jgi:hypothetical protein
MNSDRLFKFVDSIDTFDIASPLNTIVELSKAIISNSKDIRSDNEDFVEHFSLAVKNFYDILDLNNDGEVNLLNNKDSTRSLTSVNSISEIEIGSDLKDITEAIKLDLNNPNVGDAITTIIQLIELYFTDEHYSETLVEIDNFMIEINKSIDALKNEKTNDKTKDIILTCLVVIPLIKLQKIEVSIITSEELKKEIIKTFGNTFRLNILMRILNRLIHVINSTLIKYVAGKVADGNCGCWCC